MNKRLHAAAEENGTTQSLAAVPGTGTLAIADPRTFTPYPPPLPGTSGKKNGIAKAARREPALTKDALYVIWKDHGYHVVAESYFYKTEPYYTILSLEYRGEVVKPSSRAVLEAYVIPVCLERVRARGIPVCDWGISQAYVPLPALIYGLNYYATNAEYAVVRDNSAAKERIRHITNNGKYPFCFQKFPEGGEIAEYTAIFGKTVDPRPDVAACASAVYDLFGLPLVRMIFIRHDGSCLLSSLSPVHYSRLDEQERAILAAHICSQEFL